MAQNRSPEPSRLCGKALNSRNLNQNHLFYKQKNCYDLTK